MMMFLQGVIRYRGDGYVMVVNQGLGYKVSVPQRVEASSSGEVALYLHEVIRDSERELFGFVSVNQLELFWNLIAISGVGPRIAQKIVFANSVDQVKAGIMAGDLDALTDVSGVGKKTAQKIVLELKGALAEEPQASTGNMEAVEALVGLGYARRDAQEAVRGTDTQDTEACIRAALKTLSL